MRDVCGIEICLIDIRKSTSSFKAKAVLKVNKCTKLGERSALGS